jgi:hypothetical protein
MIYNIKISNGDRNDILDYIYKQKKPFTVVDVGGSMGGWSSPVVDCIIDFNDPINNSEILHFKCDITNPSSWLEILNYVEKNGKFDFCICSHTLEDIMNPVFVCEQICKISKEGYIAVPSKYKELYRFESHHNYRGFIHHRWVFNIENNKFIGYPKINYLDSNNIFDGIANNSENIQDLSFYWKEDIEIEYVNNNYLGPNLNSVIDYYNGLFI